MIGVEIVLGGIQVVSKWKRVGVDVRNPTER
jgi:hypothetical protein